MDHFLDIFLVGAKVFIPFQLYQYPFDVKVLDP
jgi:hypothetical protein